MFLCKNDEFDNAWERLEVDKSNMGSALLKKRIVHESFPWQFFYFKGVVLSYGSFLKKNKLGDNFQKNNSIIEDTDFDKVSVRNTILFYWHYSSSDTLSLRFMHTARRI